MSLCQYCGFNTRTVYSITVTLVVPGKIESKNVAAQQVLRHHVVHDGSLLSSRDSWVRQAEDAVKLGHHKVLARLVCAQTDLLVRDHNPTNLQDPIHLIHVIACATMVTTLNTGDLYRFKITI